MIHRSELEARTSARTDVIDLTDRVAEVVCESAIREGQVLVFTPGSTAALTTIEYESGVVADLCRAIERMAPDDLDYQHDRRWGDGNGYSHVRSALVGPSVVVPISEGQMMLGTWQQLVLLDFDNRPRSRRVVVQVSGE